MMRRRDRFLYRKEKTLGERILLFPLYLLSLPYGWAVRARSFFYSFKLLKTKTLPCPVISVGNITVGGTGKTPLVMTLAKRLMDRGISIAILSRGYKGTKTSEPVVSDGKNLFLSPEESGDEPFLMAQVCKGVPVLVGKDRFENGGIALRQFGMKGTAVGRWVSASSPSSRPRYPAHRLNHWFWRPAPFAKRDSQGAFIPSSQGPSLPPHQSGGS